MDKWGGAMVSAGTAVERAAVVGRDDLFSAVQAFLDEPFISVAPLDAEQAVAAGNAYRRYGKGRHLAGLNLGDVSLTRLPGGGTSRCCSRVEISLAPTSRRPEQDGLPTWRRIRDLQHSFASRALTLGEGLPMIGKPNRPHPGPGHRPRYR